jgi:hypothetical protein
MGVFQRIVDHDKLFHEHVSNEPIIVNDVVESSEADKRRFDEIIYTRYSSEIDSLNNLPACDCKELTGTPNLGLCCPNCNTVVTSPMDQKLEPLVWIRAPAGVNGLINPVIWTLLSEEFTVSGFNIISWYCDTRYDPGVKEPKIMEKIKLFGFERGYNNFINNFDSIIGALFELRDFKPKKERGPDGVMGPQKESELAILLRENRNKLFSKYLPVPNRSLLVIEETNLGVYVDPIIPMVIDAIRTLVGIDARPTGVKVKDGKLSEADLRIHATSIRTKENRTVRAIMCLANFFDDFYSTIIAKKEGILRKHVYATRCNWAGRAVIRSITDVHHYRELHLPWAIAVTMLRIHLINKLYKLDYTPNEAFSLLNAHIEKTHPLIRQLLNELIEESPYMGIPCVLQRNPSLERGSAQLMFITKVREDASIPTISMSILCVAGFNADFDGDSLNISLPLDRFITTYLENLAPHKSMFGLEKPRKVTKNPSIPSPIISTQSAWIEARDPVDELKFNRMMAMLVNNNSVNNGVVATA